MIKGNILICILLVILSVAAIGQNSKQKASKNAKQQQEKSTLKFAPPEWAKSTGYTGNNPIYFPDYYAFYDPQRGYVYWNRESNSWSSSLELPSFMSNIDMSHVRIQILEGLSLDLHPETNYPNYMKLYPSKLNDNNIPVPNQMRLEP